MSLSSGPKSAPTGSSMEFAPKQKQDSIRLRDALLSRGVSNSGRRLLFGLEVAMEGMLARSTPGVWFVLFSFLQLTTLAPPASAQAAEKIPQPEYYGEYALIDGKLFGLGEIFGKNTPKSASLPEPISAQVALRQAKRFGPMGGPNPSPKVMSATVRPMPNDIQFLVFSQNSMEAARKLRLEQLTYVRNANANRQDPVSPTGQMQRVQENAWDFWDDQRGARSELRKNMKLLLMPVKEHSDMVLVVPSARLKPGVYWLWLQQSAFMFAVEPLKEGEATSCADIEYTYHWDMPGEWVYSKFNTTPCHDSSISTPPSGSPGLPAGAPPPSTSAAASCSDYNSCLKSGNVALQSAQWDQSLAYFRRASSLEPTKPDAWAEMGRVYLASGQQGEVPAMWDKALGMGGPVIFTVCHERGLSGCEVGDLSLGPKQVSFTTANGQKLFSVAPSDVGLGNTFNRRENVYLRLKVEGKNYNFDFLPFGVICKMKLLVECPQQGVAQQLAVASYVSQTIPKLASGTLARSEQPPTAKPACSGATDLGYSLLAGGHLYKVRGIATASEPQVHVFFDEKDALVRDPNKLQKLALGAWTREKIVAGSSARDASTRISTILSASRSIQLDTALADFAARGMTEALEAVVTGGISLAKTVPNLTYGVLKNQLLNSPRTFFIVAARTGLERSLDRYRQLGTILPPADATALDVTTLEAVKQLYTQAYVLELPNEALATAMMPTTITQQLRDLVGSMLSEVVPGALNPTELVPLGSLLTLQKSLANAGRALPELQAYSESLQNVLRFAAEEDQVIGAWAKRAADACSP